jgi:threonine synthase
LRALRESGGTALRVSDESADAATHDMHRLEGIDATIEGGATLAAMRILVKRGVPMKPPIVLFNTGSSLKYMSSS